VENTNKIGSLIGKIVTWENGTGEVILHDRIICKDNSLMETIRLKPLTGDSFPTDHYVKDIEIL
jgi:hypothetical protein